MADTANPSSTHADGTTRRDFLDLVTWSTLAVGAGALAWPLIDQMNPSADVLALSSVEVDLSPIAEGAGGDRQVARQAGVHPPPHRRGDQRGRRRAAGRAARPADRRRARDQAGMAGRSSASAPISAACRWATSRASPRATTMAGSARAMARTTTRPAASARGRRRSTCAVPEYAFLTDTSVRIG